MPRLGIEQQGIHCYYRIDAATGCWNGKMLPGKDGYCRIGVTRRRYTTLHRYIYERFYGGIPRGYEIHHKCGNKRCCNILHLKAVNSQEHRHLYHRKGRGRTWRQI